MLCLSDTDLILKLSALDIINEALASFDASRKDIRITPELSHYLQSKAFTRHPHDVVRRAISFTKGLRLVPDVSYSDVAALQKVRGIHYGEQILFASSANLRGDFILATGDKASLRALAAAQGCDHIRSRLKKRVVCLEQMVLGAIRLKGYTWVNRRAALGCSCDDCMTHAFANGTGKIDEAGCRKWLVSFTDKLREQTGELLYR